MVPRKRISSLLKSMPTRQSHSKTPHLLPEHYSAAHSISKESIYLFRPLQQSKTDTILLSTRLWSSSITVWKSIDAITNSILYLDVSGLINVEQMKDNLGRGIRRSGGIEFLWERPMTLAFLILAQVLLLAPYLLDKLKIRDRLMSN